MRMPYKTLSGHYAKCQRMRLCQNRQDCFLYKNLSNLRISIWVVSESCGQEYGKCWQVRCYKKKISFFFRDPFVGFFFSRLLYQFFFFHCCLIDHFTIVGCDLRPQVSMYAIDSLKQLAMKFLEKEELAHYHFQKEFLKPFETIMQNNSNVKIRYAMKIKFGSFSAKKKKILKKIFELILFIYFFLIQMKCQK